MQPWRTLTIQTKMFTEDLTFKARMNMICNQSPIYYILEILMDTLKLSIGFIFSVSKPEIQEITI